MDGHAADGHGQPPPLRAPAQMHGDDDVFLDDGDDDDDEPKSPPPDTDGHGRAPPLRAPAQMHDDDDVFLDDGDDDDDEPKSPPPDTDEDEDMGAAPARVKTAATSSTDTHYYPIGAYYPDEDRPPPPLPHADDGSDLAKSQATDNLHRPSSGQAASGKGQAGAGTPIQDPPLVSPDAVSATAAATTATIVATDSDNTVSAGLATVSPRESTVAEKGLGTDDMSDGDAKRTTEDETCDDANPSNGAGGRIQTRDRQGDLARCAAMANGVIKQVFEYLL